MHYRTLFIPTTAAPTAASHVAQKIPAVLLQPFGIDDDDDSIIIIIVMYSQKQANTHAHRLFYYLLHPSIFPHLFE